jgi:hypothetical protein
VIQVNKATITRVFVGSLVAMGAGLVLFFAAGIAAIANSSFVMNGPDVVGIQSTPLALTMVVLGSLGILAMIGGGFAQLVSWVGAVLNTARLEDKTWFVVLLLLGLVSFGFVAMIAYVIAGPDGTAPAPQRRIAQSTPVTTA